MLEGLTVHFYANFFTVGALIPTVFNVFMSYLFLSIKERSKPTFHLGLAFLYLAIFNFGFFIAAGVYHPYAAFHRWMTVGFILLHMTHVNMFVLNLHSELPRRAGWFLLGFQYAVSLATTVVFILKTVDSQREFNVSAHQWDFNADVISGVIGYIIISYIVLFIAFTVWKACTVKTESRFMVLLMGLSYLVASIIPSVANVLSREGVIDRGTFQLLWDFFSLVGLYILVVLYLNFTRDRFPIMSKIVSIILLTVLLILQGFSYNSFLDNERSYDEIHEAYAALSESPGYEGGRACYVSEFSIGDEAIVGEYRKNPASPVFDHRMFASEYLNAATYRKIAGMDEGEFTAGVTGLLAGCHPGFGGYANAITGWLKKNRRKGPGAKKDLLEYLVGLQSTVDYHRERISSLPDSTFRNALAGYLRTTKGGFAPFRKAIENYCVSEQRDGPALKSGIISLLAPIGYAGQRHFRNRGSTHFISYLHVDNQRERVFESGFPYTSYRANMHRSSVRIIYAVFIVFVVVVLGFNLFFRGVLIVPLHRLVDGLRDISRGRLDVRIPAWQGDEIGFVTSSFNQMATTIHRTKKSLDEYMQTLEQKVEERTRELARSEEKYRSILDAGIIGYFEVDLDGTFTYCNGSFREYIGYSEQELIGMNYRQITPDDEADRIFREFSRVYAGESTVGIVEMKVIRKDRQIVYGENYVSVMKDTDDAITGFRSVGIDITERKATEAALRESEEKYRTFVESATDGIFRNDIKGNFLYVNPSGQALLGYSEEELLKINYRELVVPGHVERVLDHYRKQFRDRQEENYIEFPITRKDGVVLWLGQKTKLSCVPGGSYEFHGISRDVTERKKAEEIQRELEEHKTRFFANISHEIRTPLTLMLSPIESVLQGDYGSRINRAFFDNLYRNGLRLLKLVNNLLDFSKIEAGRMKMKVCETDMVGFVRNYVSAVHSAAEAKDVSIAFSPHSERIPVFVDTEKMDKVVMNLFSNSLKFTGSGGSITVVLREDEIYCYIEFIDTGDGIPARSINSIFDRFSQADTSATRRHEGTGIGLALAKELIEMHGGTITVESRYREDHPDDHGSKFTLTILKGRDHFAGGDAVEFIDGDDLDESVTDRQFHGMREMHDLGPVDERSSSLPGAPCKSGVEGGGISVPAHAGSARAGVTPTVLIVDDNPDMRNFLVHLLQNLYDVHWAENGMVGLDCVDRLSPDIVITDVMMPEMDGNEMTRRLKSNEAHRHIPVIMLTAKAEMVHKLEGLEQGADDFLTKPFNSKELLARIRTLLKTKEYEKEILRRNYEIEQDLEVARLLQGRLLPEHIEGLPGFDLHAVYIPMDKVGGDFYDYNHRGTDIELFIADVSGHGLPGAFLAMMTKMSLESVPERDHTSLTLGHINDVICRSTVNSNFVTAFLCRIDTRTRIMRFSNAGHVPPLIHRRVSGEFLELTAKGMPLGWFRNLSVEEKEIQLLPGDRLFLFTDGITECIAQDGSLFGDDRLRDFLVSGRDRSPVELCGDLLAHLGEFSGSGKFDDDVTIIVFDVQ